MIFVSSMEVAGTTQIGVVDDGTGVGGWPVATLWLAMSEAMLLQVSPPISTARADTASARS